MVLPKLIRLQAKAKAKTQTMTTQSICQSENRRAFADVALLATTIGLVLSLAIAITTVSIGIARADTLDAIVSDNSGRACLAVFFALVLTGMGGLTAAVVRDVKSPKRCD
jgi:hypothetical protein